MAPAPEGDANRDIGIARRMLRLITAITIQAPYLFIESEVNDGLAVAFVTITVVGAKGWIRHKQVFACRFDSHRVHSEQLRGASCRSDLNVDARWTDSARARNIQDNDF